MTNELNHDDFTSEMQVRELTSDLINSIDDLNTTEQKSDAIKYAMKMLMDQLSELA